MSHALLAPLHPGHSTSHWDTQIELRTAAVVTDEPSSEHPLPRTILDSLERWLTREEILVIILAQLFTAAQINELLKAYVAVFKNNPPTPLSDAWQVIRQKEQQAVRNACGGRLQARNRLPHVQVNPVGRHVAYWTPGQ